MIFILESLAVTHTDLILRAHTQTLKSLFKDVLLPWETPAATTAPEWIMGPSYTHDRAEAKKEKIRNCSETKTAQSRL